MKKKIIISTIFLVIVAMFTSIISINKVYADALKEICFEDENMYNRIKNSLDYKNIKYIDKGNNTIEMTQSDIENVTEFGLLYGNITNISGIENFNNLTYLDLSNNQINDISNLSKLTNLTYLNLNFNEISDIGALKDLISLTDLSLSFNEISDISALSKLTSLNYLSSSYTQISDISVLKDLTSLTDLYLSSNEISDISSLSGLTNLTNLDLGYNKISDISALDGFSNLKNLYLQYNQIIEIPDLTKSLNLEKLFLNDNQISNLDKKLPKSTSIEAISLHNNKISDASILDSESYRYIKDGSYCGYHPGITIYGQQLTMDVKSKTVKLPNIFLQAKDPNSRFYKEGIEYTLENCKFSEDGNSVIVDEGKKTASIKINGTGSPYSTEQPPLGTILNINVNVPLETTLSKTPEEMTNGNVKVTISANNMLENLEGWSLSKDETVLTKEYDKNTQEEVVVTDKHGNKQSIKVIVDNIDKDPPIIDYSTRKNEDGSIEIILKSNEKVKEIEGWNLSEDKMTLTKTYKEAKEEQISVYDLLGNETKVNLKIEMKNNKLNANIENEKDNPKTGDILIYIVAVLFISIIIFGITKKYKFINK